MDWKVEIGGIPMMIDGVRWKEADAVPANFRPFVTGNGRNGACLRVDGTDAAPDLAGLTSLSTSYNDLGQASLYQDSDGDWIVALTPCPGEAPRIMRMQGDFGEATVWLKEDDRHYDFVIDSMARIYFSQYAATRRSLMLHASVAELDGRGYLFMGESGVGKSTHSRLWRETFEGCRLLNDDCPLVTADGQGGFTVSGTPWSGKTRCYLNRSCPVGGVVRLRQAPVNRFIPLDGVQAFVRFIPGMSVMTSARKLYSEATTTALELLDSVPFGVMECLPDAEAARLCRRSLAKDPPSEKIEK